MQSHVRELPCTLGQCSVPKWQSWPEVTPHPQAEDWRPAPTSDSWPAADEWRLLLGEHRMIAGTRLANWAQQNYTRGRKGAIRQQSVQKPTPTGPPWPTSKRPESWCQHPSPPRAKTKTKRALICMITHSRGNKDRAPRRPQFLTLGIENDVWTPRLQAMQRNHSSNRYKIFLWLNISHFLYFILFLSFFNLIFWHLVPFLVFFFLFQWKFFSSFNGNFLYFFQFQLFFFPFSLQVFF